MTTTEQPQRSPQPTYRWEVQSDAPYWSLIDASAVEITGTGDLVFFVDGEVIQTFAARHWHSCERKGERG
ncbi:hypothetical protein [Curtobacterium sp. P97]|jgi:hypothetical protein|uniref:hypothetical protein n=1 Tax=Curtobacterium sp. P97 TaxID=2939562 RepID=UPI00203B6873|nr:hypothetical protein [Curtobacterium sp. P97]MCM3521762.1 hypothetical protein [Curtobacterium sp. P97]